MAKLVIRRNIRLISWYSFFIELRFLSVVSVLFYAAVANSYALGMAIFTIALFSRSLFEIPTGIFSDKIGRKKTMIIGTFLDAVGCAFEAYAGFYNSYELLVLGAIISGISGSLYSGTEDALLFETLASLKKKHKFHEASGKMESMMQLSSGLAALCGGALAYVYSYTFVAFLTVVPMLICFLISLFFIEPTVHERDKEHSSLAHFKDAIRNFASNKQLLALGVANIINNSFGGNSHRFQIALFETLIPLWLIGVVRSLKQFGGVVGTWYAGRIIDKFGHYNVLFGGKSCAVVIKLSALALNSAVTPFIFSVMNFLYGPSEIAMRHLMQNEFSNRQRATMGSVVSLFSSVGMGTVAIFIGWVADKTSPLTALYILTMPEFVTLWIYRKYLKGAKPN